MGVDRFTAWFSGAPARQFAVLSLLVISFISVTLSLSISYFLRTEMLDQEWRSTASHIQLEASRSLSPSDFNDPSNRDARKRFRVLYENSALMTDIVRMKIYDRTGTVVWSDERRLFGRQFPDNPHLRDALAGRTMVNLGSTRQKSEHIYEREAFRRLVELYVPITFTGLPGVTGVAEVYKDPAELYDRIQKGQAVVVTIALIGGVLLYFGLFGIYRRATGQIEAQGQDLERRRRQLVAANQELVAVQDQLLKAERMAAVGEIVTAVVHGLRSPLASIRASAQAALLDCSRCENSSLGPKSLANAITQVDALQTRSKELLDFVRPASGQREPVNVNDLLRGVLEVVGRRLDTANIEVTARLDPTVPPVRGDAIMLRQVFLNVIDNAIDAMAEGGGTLTLLTAIERADGSGCHVVAEVRDTGIGIPPEKLQKILEPFYTTKQAGTGLGLAIAKRFTEAHGGTVRVSSRAGQGTTIRVTLPAGSEG